MAGVGFSFLTIHSRSPVLLVSDQCIPDGIYLVLTRGYIEGFGDVNSEFWLVLNKINRLSESRQMF